MDAPNCIKGSLCNVRCSSLTLAEISKIDKNKKGVTILMVTHDMHLMLEYTNKVIALSKGEKIADNVPAYILTNREIIEKANLKETSLHQLALKCGIKDTTKFVNRFIDYDRRVR